MNKIKMTIITLGLVLSLVACGNNNETKNENTNGTTTQESKSENGSNEDTQKEDGGNQTTGEISYDSLMAMEPSPAEDFNVQKNQDGGQTITAYVGKQEMVYVPDEIDGLPVTEITEYTFANNQTPKAIRLGDNIKKINFGSFGTNTTIEIFVAGKGLEIIGDSAFIGAEALKEVHLNEGLKEIEQLAFSQTKSLKEITIPESVEKIGTGIFHFGDKGLVIKGKAGSKAEEIAKEGELTFEEIK